MTSAPHPDGAEVQGVSPGSPAQSAGLRTGDVITGVDGREVSDPEDVSAALDGLEPGDEIRVEVARDGERRTLTVELAARPQRVP